MKLFSIKICFCCLVVVAVCLLVSCSKNKVTKNLQELFGREVILPEKLSWRIYNRDTIIKVGDVPRILVYYNAVGCSSCKIKELVKWKKLITQIDDSNDSLKAQFLFIFNTSRGQSDLNVALFTYDFNHPIMCDDKENFEEANLLPEESLFHTFLLDRDNKIQLVGSPIDNDKMWQLYKQRIAEINNKQT